MKLSAAFLSLCIWQSTAFNVPTTTTTSSTRTTRLLATPDETAPLEISGPGGRSRRGDDPWDLNRLPPTIRCEGGNTRRTWNFGDVSREVVQVVMTSEGRPMNADIEVWIGPDWTPLKLNSYSEDGRERPVQTLIGTRKKAANVEIRNTGGYEFPLSATCLYATPPLEDIRDEVPKDIEGRYVEGGAVYSVPFDPAVDQVQVLLNTDTRQLNARVELLNGPNNPKQQFEIFTNNGLLNSLYVVFNTPGSGNVVRVTNIAPLEFPCKAYITAI